MIYIKIFTTSSGNDGVPRCYSTNIDSYTINTSTNLITKVMKLKTPTLK